MGIWFSWEGASFYGGWLLIGLMGVIAPIIAGLEKFSLISIDIEFMFWIGCIAVTAIVVPVVYRLVFPTPVEYLN